MSYYKGIMEDLIKSSNSIDIDLVDAVHNLKVDLKKTK